MCENAMSSATASSADQDDVEMLMQQVADAHSLEFKSRAADAGKHPVHRHWCASRSVRGVCAATDAAGRGARARPD